jgi:hypothetical protein
MVPAPAPKCPVCDFFLTYKQTIVGGVLPPERWDYFECRACGPLSIAIARGRSVRSLDTMTWTCPSSEAQIRHRPEAPKLFRRHVCRLELVVGEAGDRLIVAPLGTRRRARGGDPLGRHVSSLSGPSAAPIVRDSGTRPHSRSQGRDRDDALTVRRLTNRGPHHRAPPRKCRQAVEHDLLLG